MFYYLWEVILSITFLDVCFLRMVNNYVNAILKMEVKTIKHFSRMLVAATWCMTGGGWVYHGYPEMHKFEQVSSVDHQMSVAELGVGVLGPCLREEGVCLGVGLSKGKGMGIAGHAHPLPLEGT